MANDRSSPLENVLDTALERTDGEEVTVADLLKAFGARSFGPILIVLGIFAVSPIGAIPGVPAAIGAVVILIAGQLLFGREHLWLPSRLNDLGFERDKIRTFRKKAGRWLQRIDRLITERMDWATGDLAQRIAAAACIAMAVFMIPLELVPFAVALPGAAIILYGLALTARDGLVMVIAALLTLVTILVAYKVIS